MNKRVLIISYTFPPAPGIGGRRWAKFAKYLKRRGHIVKIIAASPKGKELSEWAADGNELRNDVYFIDSSYPESLGISPQSLKEKLRYRLSLLYARLKNPGNYYDKSNYWESQLLKECRKLIRWYKISTLICTVGPFRSSSFLLRLKHEFPQLKFIVDYRDPWTNNKTSFGFTTISPKRLRYEQALEERTIKEYDHITAVSSEMGEHFKKMLTPKEFSEKFTALPNGFDGDDFKPKNGQNKMTENHQLKIGFTGTFYNTSIHVFEKLVETVRLVEEKYPDKKGYVKFVFAGHIPAAIKTYFDKQPHVFSFVGKKSLKETYSLLSDMDLCCLFLTDDMNYSFSTKFYEYLAMGKKIISFSKQQGSNGKFIEENELGISVDFENMEQVITDLFLSEKEKFLTTYKTSFSPDNYSLESLTKKLETLLK